MKQIRIWIVAIACIFGTAAERASAQMPIAVQHLFFSFFNDYENDIFATNAVLTNEVSLIRTVEVITGNVDHAFYYDIGGPDWTNLAGMEIVREVNMTNGAEGIFLRGFGRQTDISDHFTNVFGPSYLAHFTAQATNQFPAINNYFDAELPIHRASEIFRQGKPTLTNNLRTEQMFFLSMNTTNLKFNYLGYGTVVEHPIIGRLVKGGTLYSNNVETFLVHGIGTMYHTGSSNVFDQGAVPPIPSTGPMYGTFWSGEPFFMALTNGPQ